MKTKQTIKAILCYILVTVLASCKKEEIKYPVYSLESKDIVPDSLKKEYRAFITETVRAANQHLYAGDYEDIDETIIQAERTADNSFSVKVLCLRKQIDENYWNDIIITPSEFTQKEKIIFKNLQNK